MVECIFTFVSTRVLEVNVAGKMVADVCRAAVKANAKVTLKKLLPFVCSRVKVLASSKQPCYGFSIYYARRISLKATISFSLLLTHTGAHQGGGGGGG